jgi:hypothetical protein
MGIRIDIQRCKFCAKPSVETYFPLYGSDYARFYGVFYAFRIEWIGVEFVAMLEVK